MAARAEAEAGARPRGADGQPDPATWPLGRAWMAALRLRTLPAGAAPVLAGLGLAAHAGAFDAGVAAATLGAALLLQVAVNLANDYYDHLKGVDRADRLGPPRVTGTALSVDQVRGAMAACLAAAAALGLLLVLRGGWPILAIGLASLASVLAYAGGPRPLGHLGLGDLFVFAFFGPVAVAGTYFLQAGAFPLEAWLAGVPVGALSAAILVVNNVRDAPTDARAGKRTLAVRLGPRGSWAEYGLLLAVAYAAPLALWARLGPGALAPLLSLPLAAWLARDGPRREGRALNPLLARTALLTGLYGALLGGGLAL